MIINYWAVLVCGIAAMGIGALWYGPLFGKAWAKVIGATASDMAERKKMQKRALPLYITQFLITLFQVWVLAHYMQGIMRGAAMMGVFWTWIAFIVPTLAGSAMWNNESAKRSWARFLIQAGYQLVIFIVFGLILGAWR